MKVGVIARADNRGIAIQTWEAARNLPADRVLVVREPGAESMGFAFQPEWYQDEATVVDFNATDGTLPEATVREWMAGLDVIYIVETPYDWQLPRWAREQGIATVVHANPEFYRHGGDPNLEHPTGWWSPTDWLLDRMHPDTHVVPMPVAADRILRTQPHDGDHIRVLCPVGHQAAMDRAGVRLVLDAARYYPPEVHITIRVQDRRLRHHSASRSPRFTIETGGQPDYWAMYQDHDVLLHPRRYGGLSLPANEAAAAGLALVMPSCYPNEATWPISPLSGKWAGRPLRSQAGPIPVYNADLKGIAATMGLMCAPPVRHAFQEMSLSWAEAHSWENLRPVWLRHLEAAADLTTA